MKTLNDECVLCPRNCRVNRYENKKGRCQETSDLRIARASLHMWEEPCISGDEGSGTVFFTGCPLGCVFCQNHSISSGGSGVTVSPYDLVKVFLRLQAMGANNINLVTPTHFADQIATALREAKARGLSLPIVYNTSGYENVETLKMLDGLIDIYLPDFKYVSSDLSRRYSDATDYFEVAKRALGEMFRQVKQPQLDERGMMRGGMIVRHLILPGCTADSKRVLKYLFDTYGDDIFISIMNQYTPLKNVAAYPEINRKVTKDEYDEVVDYAVDLGITNAFVQDGEAAQESFIPEFENFSLENFLT